MPGIKESKAEVLAILEVVRIFSFSSKEALIVESESSNATHWMSLTISIPWRFHYYINNIKASSSSHVSFSYVPSFSFSPIV